MPTVCACTLFFNVPEFAVAELAALYEAIAEPADGYLVRLETECLLVDAVASHTADWARQTELATALSGQHLFALSIFMVGDLWALALANDGQPGPVAAFTPDNTKTLEDLPHQLLAVEKMLADVFPEVEMDTVDRIFGALLEMAVTSEEALTELLAMLACSPDWLRWAWYETIPEQLFLDPDLAARVTPLGEARGLWEE